ncbi:MAG: hypothetical protein ACKO9V_06430 [Candidatus Kapaibacterium sp.]
MLIRHLIAALTVVVFAPQTMRAQKGDASPLGPGQYFERFGGFLSAGGIRQSGSFTVDCPCQSFTGGGGSEFSVGAVYERVPASSYIWGVTAGYRYRTMDARYVLREDTTLRSLDGQSLFPNVQIPFRHSSTISVSSITVMPYVKRFIAKSLFARVGLAAGVVVGSTKDFRKTLLTNTVTLPNDDVIRIEMDRAALEARGLRFSGDNEVVLEEGPMNDVSAFNLAVVPAVGFQWQVGKRMFLVPMFEYSLPVTGVSSTDTSLRMHALRAVVEVHVDF